MDKKRLNLKSNKHQEMSISMTKQNYSIYILSQWALMKQMKIFKEQCYNINSNVNLNIFI